MYVCRLGDKQFIWSFSAFDTHVALSFSWPVESQTQKLTTAQLLNHILVIPLSVVFSGKSHSLHKRS
jgi:hypothetical protein